MFEYMTAQEAAEKWNVSLRWVQRLCKENRIEGAMNIERKVQSREQKEAEKERQYVMRQEKKKLSIEGGNIYE